MSVPEEFWQELELEVDAVRRRADFYRNYAAAAARTPEIDIVQFETFDGSDLGVIPFDDDDEREGRADPDRYLPPWAEREPWIETAERADALRQAAIAMLLTSPGGARELLLGAADLYEADAPAYSRFLRAGILPERPVDPGWEAALILNGEFPYGRARGSGEAVSAARVIHLLLLVGASEAASTEFERAVGNAAEALTPQLSKPFGTAGSPLSNWLALALALCVRLGHLDRRALAEWLIALARPHGDQLAAARSDTHHWQNLHFRVDLIDLDLAIAVRFVNRRLGAAELPELSLRDFRDRADDVGGLPLLAQISLAVGIELGEDEPEPPERVPAGVN